MNNEKHDFFLHSNEVNHINKEDYAKIELLVNAAKAFARSTYQCVYIITSPLSSFLMMEESGLPSAPYRWRQPTNLDIS